MIRIRPIGESGRSYYLDDPAREVADLTSQFPQRRWVGAASPRFGLSGVVDPVSFAAVLRGRPPGSTLQPSTRRQRDAFDLVIAAPKPVSILFASPDNFTALQTLLAHQRGVDAALAYLEVRAAGVQRRRLGESEVIPAEGFVAAEFVHGVSRSGDPHLHSHVVVGNFSRDQTGRFGALDRRSLMLHSPAADAVYRGQLRFELTRRLNVRWEWDLEGAAQIAGISDGLVVALSGRGAQRRQGDMERPPKEFVPSRAAALELWRDRARFDLLLDGRPRRHGSIGFLDEHRFAGEIHRIVPRARDVVMQLANSALSGIESSVIARVMQDLQTSTLGHGPQEHPLSPKQVLPPPSVIRQLGPRPTNRIAFESWSTRSRFLRSSERSLDFNGRDRVEIEPLVR